VKAWSFLSFRSLSPDHELRFDCQADAMLPN
jgi:hypothetical protein